ncbi:MAG: YgjV family protein [Pseudomonadales bacterium]|jgi:large-conductance mechanosensitive channel|nr:YgjV family protein [Pseudomonadales bacterium]
MNITTAFIASQIIVVFSYSMLAATYLAKKQTQILLIGIGAVLLNAVAFTLLGAWTGLAMCLVALIRNVIRYLADKHNHNFGQSKLFLGLVFLSIIAVTIPTYDGFLSLMAVFPTLLYSYSVWQRSPTIYKICGFPVAILWIVYNLYIWSVFGFILETALLVFVLVGTINSLRQSKKQIPTETNDT